MKVIVSCSLNYMICYTGDRIYFWQLYRGSTTNITSMCGRRIAGCHCVCWVLLAGWLNICELSRQSLVFGCRELQAKCLQIAKWWTVWATRHWLIMQNFQPMEYLVLSWAIYVRPWLTVLKSELLFYMLVHMALNIRLYLDRKKCSES